MLKLKLHKLTGMLFCCLAIVACNDEDSVGITVNLSQVKPAADFTDVRDGHVYKCIQVGDQIWMAENLAYFLPQGGADGCYTYGQELLEMPAEDEVELSDEQWKEIAYAKLEEMSDQIDPLYRDFIKMYIDMKSPYYSEDTVLGYIKDLSPEYHDKLIAALDEAKADVYLGLGREAMLAAEEENGGYYPTYGFLYSLDGARAAVPDGWRLPTDADWMKLEATLGMPFAELESMNSWRGKGVGDCLKAGGGSGFEALFGGCDAYESSTPTMLYIKKSECGYFWCDAEQTIEGQGDDSGVLIEEGVVRQVAIYSSAVWRGTTRLTNNFRPVLYSVRCVKDAN